LKSTRSPLSGLAKVAGTPGEPVPLDATDRRLLTLLARDARVSQRHLGRELGMSPPAIGERIARLERLGVIRGYTVALDWSALGYVTCYLAVSAMQGAEQGPIMAKLAELPEVEDVAVITGSIDMLARVRVRDHPHLRELLLDQVWQIPGVQRTETFLTLAEVTRQGFLADLTGDGDEPVPARARGRSS
jgi:Lrp/AsnC family leucine-responsive transcriptional regulator